MITRRPYRLPEDKERKLNKAVKLEWATIFFMLTIIVVIYMTMGSSQAMKAAWIEDMLSLVPPIAFLVAETFRGKAPNQTFPFGYRRAVTIAFLCASVALFAFGLFIFYDSTMKLIMKEHPTLGIMPLFGRDVWMGWVMIAALTYSAIPPVILGRMKLPLSRELHEKTLHADAQMNKADWMTALAGIVGVLGIGMGWWWADAAAALVISTDIVWDGFTNLKAVIGDLMDRRPTGVDRKEKNDVPEQVAEALRRLDWVQDADVQLREEGHVFSGDAFVVPRDEHDLLRRLQEAADAARSVDWRVYDVVVTPVPSLRDGRVRQVRERERQDAEGVRTEAPSGRAG